MGHNLVININYMQFVKIFSVGMRIIYGGKTNIFNISRKNDVRILRKITFSLTHVPLQINLIQEKRKPLLNIKMTCLSYGIAIMKQLPSNAVK